ncbi:MAG TPA: SRPBCC family protein [Acidobacteriaceae bacterium]|nr:SRPBCC family protein [Acidobacteriaceae bacterium]
MPSDCIEREIVLNAPVSRVWRALTDHNEFGAWFRVKIASAFKAGEEASGPLTEPGHEQITWRAVIQEIDPPQYFAFTWHPYSIDPNIDYSKEVPTLVEFHLQSTKEGGTRLNFSECGFNDLPPDRYKQAFEAHDKGWTQQMKNISDYIAAHP